MKVGEGTRGGQTAYNKFAGSYHTPTKVNRLPVTAVWSLGAAGRGAGWQVTDAIKWVN